MDLQRMHDEHAYHGDVRFGLATMKWHGWGSPVGLGLFVVEIAAALYLLHLAGLIG